MHMLTGVISIWNDTFYTAWVVFPYNNNNKTFSINTQSLRHNLVKKNRTTLPGIALCAALGLSIYSTTLHPGPWNCLLPILMCRVSTGLLSIYPGFVLVSDTLGSPFEVFQLLLTAASFLWLHWGAAVDLHWWSRFCSCWRSHSVFNLCSHGHKSLLYVGSVFGGCF